MFSIGLTGGIGSGKTFIAEILKANFDIKIFDSDYIAKEIIQKNKSVKKSIILNNSNQVRKLIKDAFNNARSNEITPSMIIAHTVKGKGVSFMEDNNNWHYKTPNSEELENALNELKGK